MNFLRLLSPLLFLVFSLTASAADNEAPGTLKIGTSAGYPPLTFRQSNKLMGMEIDLANALATQLNKKAELVEIPFDELINALNNGKVDIIMSGLSITEERNRRVLFSDPYMEIGQMGLIRSEDLVAWSQPETLFRKGQKVGVKSGTTGERFVETQLRAANIVRFASIDKATDALVEKKIDIFIHDAPTIWRLTANFDTEKAGLMGLYRPLTEEYLAWAVRKQDGKLATSLNTALEAMKQDGTLNRLKGKWIPVQVKVRQ